MGRRTLLTVAVLLGVARGAAAAEPIALVFSEFYPITRTENGQPAGPGLEVARRVIGTLDVTPAGSMTPLRRLLMMSESQPIVIAALVRTASRDEHFQWIGELYRDSLVMVTRKPRGRIDDLETARKLGRIGVNLGGIAEALLREQHFTNLETSQDMTAEARKLASGRIEAWCGLRQSVRESWNAIGGDADDIDMGAEIIPVSIWMAASPSVPAEMVEEMRRRFAQLQRGGELDRILAGLR
jgi:polar amino acid transport system substrate-binding protein